MDYLTIETAMCNYFIHSAQVQGPILMASLRCHEGDMIQVCFAPL